MRVSPAGSLLRGVAAFGLVALMSGCDSLFDPDSSDLEENMEKWADSRIQDYRFRFQRLCFCGFVEPVEIDVIGGEIVSVTVVDTGEPPHPEFAGGFLTIEGVFAEIRDAIDREAFSLSVTYHETLGYPTSVDIDYEENTVDEEMSYRASGLMELN